MKTLSIKKILILIVFVLIVTIFVTLILRLYRPEVGVKTQNSNYKYYVNYTLPMFYNRYLDTNFTLRHSYLNGLQKVFLWELYREDEKVIAQSNKILDKASFVLLVDDLIKSGYIIQNNPWVTEVKIEEREVSEDEKSIIIVDKGRIGTFNDVPPYQTTYHKIFLQWRYDKDSRNIYFKAWISDKE